MSLHDNVETALLLLAFPGAAYACWRTPMFRRPREQRKLSREAIRDWRGTSARIDPVTDVVLEPARPGVLVQLATLSEQMAYVVGQLSHNGGSSVKDDARKAALGAKEAIDAVDALRAETREAADKLREETRAAAKLVRADLLEHTAASDKTHRELFVAVQKSGPVPQPRQPSDESQSSAD